MDFPDRPLIVIAGCGYVGQSLAGRLLARGEAVLGLCHSENSAAALTAQGIPARVCDLTLADSCAAVAHACGERRVSLVHCAASGRGGGAEQYRAVYRDGCRHLRRVFVRAERFLFTSSTSVYPQIDGAWVDESSPAGPERETGRILRETEDEVRAAGGAVVRLAGLYGPGRSVLLRNFLTGQSTVDVRTEPPATPDGRWVNQLHREDAAAALDHLLTVIPDADFSGSVWNAADATPLLQRPLYAELARRFGQPMPPDAVPDTGRKRGWSHKRVSSARLAATGWAPRYPSWFHALDHDAALVPSILAQIPS